jgi:putative ABC transport system permease protein
VNAAPLAPSARELPPGPDPLSRLRAVELVPLGLASLRARPLRTALSALGISLGIAAIVGVLGVTSSESANVLAQIDALGTNLLTVVNGNSFQGDEIELPATAAYTAARLPGVQVVSATAIVPAAQVYRTDKVPGYRNGALTVRATDGQLPSALESHLRTGRFLNPATERLPVTVLGDEAARTLGVVNLDGPRMVWLGAHWFSVVGILDPLPLAPEIDRSALVGFPIADSLLGLDGHPSRLYVRASTDRVEQVGLLLAPTIDPPSPEDVAVSRPSDALAARVAVASSTSALCVGLGAVALLVGALGIANVMVVAVLERRSEIGLRRTLGATRGHVAAQFLVESLVLSGAGGVVGVALGSAVTVFLAHQHGWTVLIPTAALWGGVGLALVLGALAGCYPALRAARLAPTDALRAV